MRTEHRSTAVRARSRRALAVAALALAGSALTLGGPLVASASAGPYLHGLSQVEAHLRMAIEVRAGRLGEYMASSETVCGLAEDAATRGDEASEAAGWSTLSQLVRRRDRPEAAAIDAAFARADADLLTLRRRFSRGWHGQPQRVAGLKRGVGRTRRGIGRLRRAMDGVAGSFPRWEARDCASAQVRIRIGAKGIPTGLAQLNQGIWQLWLVSRP